MTRHARLLSLLLVFVLVGAACGSRLPDETLQAIDAGITSGGGGGGTQLAGGQSSGDGFTAGDDVATGDLDGTDAGADTGSADGAVTAGPTTGGGEAAPADGAGPQASAAGQPQAPQETACRPGTATGPGVTQNEIKVASIVTDSGPLPGATEGSYRAAAAYLAMVNAMGGVCGRKITLLKGDDGLDPARARGEFLRLEPKVAAFVGSYAVADSGYIDLIEKTKVPYVSLTIDPSGRQLPNVFPKGVDDRVSTGPFAYWKKKNPGVKKTAILYADVGGVSANIDGTAKAIEKAGFELVQPPIAVGVADPDYTGQVRNLQDKGVEFVYLFAFEVNMHVRFNRNMRQQRYEPKIKGSNIAFNDRFSKLLGADGDGWENHLAFLPFLDPGEAQRSKAVSDFLQWNQRVFPGGQLDLFSIAGWGSAAMFVEALRKAGGDPTRALLLQRLAQVPVYDDGGIGVKRDNKTGISENCFVMAVHQGGSWRRQAPNAGFECSLGEMLKYK